MAPAGAIFKEIRFVIEDELTQCYVAIQATGDAPLGVQGWHHKTFPASKSVLEIVSGFSGEDDPLLWPLNAPVNR